MNRKGDEKKIGEILLIAIVLVIFFIGGTQLLWKSAKSPLKVIDSWLGTGLFGDEGKDLTTLNEEAQMNFNAILNDFNNCKKTSNNKACKCLGNSGFVNFSNIHTLQFNNKESSLLITKDQNKLLKAKEDFQMPSCYFNGDKKTLLNYPLTITFEDNPLLEDSNGNEVEFFKEQFFMFYKYQNGEVCWVNKEGSSKQIEDAEFCS